MASMHPVLEQTFQSLAGPLRGCPADALMRHPAGDARNWSGWQVVDHLSRSWQSTSVNLDERLQKNRPLQTRPSLQQQIGTIAVCRMGYFPKGRQSPERVLPGPNPEAPITGDALIEQIRATLDEMDRCLSKAEQQAGRARVLTHPVLGPLNVENWRLFHRAHARHHAPQLERAVRGM